MVQVNWTPQAISDLKDIADYIKKDSKCYAKLQIIRIKSRAEILKRQVYLGSLVPEFERDDTRQLIEGNYTIIYKVVTKKPSGYPNHQSFC